MCSTFYIIEMVLKLGRNIVTATTDNKVVPGTQCLSVEHQRISASAASVALTVHQLLALERISSRYYLPIYINSGHISLYTLTPPDMLQTPPDMLQTPSDTTRHAPYNV